MTVNEPSAELAVERPEAEPPLHTQPQQTQEPHRKAKPGNVRWKLFVLLLVLVTLNYVDRGSIPVAMPLIQKEFQLSPEAIGELLPTFFFAYGLMQVPAGWMIDRFGPRKMVAVSCVGRGLATAACGLACATRSGNGSTTASTRRAAG